MITPFQIRQVSEEIARRFQPERIILFGSYAYDTPIEDSDVDLLVVMPFEGRGTKKSTEIQLAVPIRFPVDLIAITPTRLQERKGLELYAGNYAGMG